MFFTVFGKESEDMLHSKLKERKTLEMFIESEYNPLDNSESPIIERHKYRIISYGKFEEEVKKQVKEADEIKDQLPDYIWLLN